MAIKAVLIAGKRIAATGAKHRRLYNKHRMNMTRRERLGIPEAE